MNSWRSTLAKIFSGAQLKAQAKLFIVKKNFGIFFFERKFSRIFSSKTFEQRRKFLFLDHRSQRFSENRFAENRKLSRWKSFLFEDENFEIYFQIAMNFSRKQSTLFNKPKKRCNSIGERKSFNEKIRVERFPRTFRERRESSKSRERLLREQNEAYELSLRVDREKVKWNSSNEEKTVKFNEFLFKEQQRLIAEEQQRQIEEQIFRKQQVNFSFVDESRLRRFLDFKSSFSLGESRVFDVFDVLKYFCIEQKNEFEITNEVFLSEEHRNGKHIPVKSASKMRQFTTLRFDMILTEFMVDKTASVWTSEYRSVSWELNEISV